MGKPSKELVDKWYKKLEKSGFDDIEAADEKSLKKYHSHYFFCRYTEETFAAKQEYFRLAALFLNTYKFESKKEQTIWEYHCEGLSIREIVKVMQSRKFKVYKDMVHLTVQRLAKEMASLGSK